MNRAKIGRVDRLGDAVLEGEHLRQLDTRERLQPFEDKRLGHRAAGDQIVTMRPVLQRQAVRFHSLPEINVVKRRQPRHHILNILEHDHSDSLAKSGFATQIRPKRR
ncbi:hypothetical protein FJU08_00720 [Martelella alba]|uniref:Uncharacterized protein n=1 Tax=Martelella alba TaxID=2590451 RepID=A0A506UIF7_9HYPH|nr:hypothetical protein [Martelella alba]TPW33124.1 hypothetical protein FJU08_00720 [Martelella alba]